MNDLLEKVIRGLECCKIPFSQCYDGGCPYYVNEGCKARLKADALELLKSQIIPRVMTLDEVKQHAEQESDKKEPVYVENIHNSDQVWAYVGTFHGTFDGYGISWRCWTARPTDEQRKAVKWE